jgi:hypothetical protein
MNGVKALPLALLSLALASGCGDVPVRHASAGQAVDALGFGLDPPAGWNVRILLGAEGRPVLHAADFPLPANDDDRGEIAHESIGLGQVYVNVRDLGAGEAGSSLPVAFAQAEFPRPSRDVTAAGHVYRVTALSGSHDPSAQDVDEVNALLSTLSLDPYDTQSVPPAHGGDHLAGYGIEVDLPQGWHGGISPGVVQAASFELSESADPREPLTPGPDGIGFTLREQGGSDAPFVTARLPLQLAASEFVPPTERLPALTGRSFVANGRKFVLWAYAGSRVPDETALEQANEALASLRVEPGDFYPGAVEPASFEAA